MEIEDKELYTKAEMLEAIRQVLFTGTPELYDNGGMHGNINLPPGYTHRGAQEAFERYVLKKVSTPYTHS